MLYEDGVIVTVTMSTQDHMALTDIADQQGESFAWILLQAVRQYIDRAESAGAAVSDDGRVVSLQARKAARTASGGGNDIA
ncbi:MAG: hypothetical protein GC187_02180 [Alphaproteobacteria bacterium]|nr:hypothetical protein [Alphaproteobacteria bacterium]